MSKIEFLGKFTMSVTLEGNMILIHFYPPLVGEIHYLDLTKEKAKELIKSLEELL